MALIGPNPSVAFVHKLVSEKEGDELSEVFSEVIQFTNGPILTNLAANERTRAKLVKYLTPDRLKEFFPELKISSDPQFVALSWLADTDKTLRPVILELISENPQRESLNVLAKLLASGNLDTKTQISDKFLDAILGMLSTETDLHWQGLATLVVKACCATHKQYIVNYVRIHNTHASGFMAANATFEEIPEIKDIVYEMKPPAKPDPAFFKLLSSLCNSKDDRLKVTQHFKEVIDENAKVNADGDNNIPAMTVKAKLLAGTTSKEMKDAKEARDQLDELSKVFEKNVSIDSLEGLACTAKLMSVRLRASESAEAAVAGTKPSSEALRGPDLVNMSKTESTKEPTKREPGLVTQLVELLKSNPSETAYPVTAILAELSRYPMKRNEDDERTYKLRRETVGETVFDSSDNQLQYAEGMAEALGVSAEICKAVLDSGVIQWYTLNCLKLTLNTKEQLALLVRELSAHQKRSLKYKLAVQGAAIIAMYLYSEKASQSLSKRAKLYASSTLARILLAIEPRVALTEKVNHLQAVKPLCDLLAARSSEATVENVFSNNNEEVTPLDTFEALLALTNLASIDDRPLRVDICRRAYGKLPDCLVSTNKLIVRAALELVCNLMLVPQGAEHFLQGDPASKSLLSILGTNVTSEDRRSRLAAAGALAMLAEWETASEQIGRNPECIEGLSRAMGLYPDDDDMLVRVLTALKVIIKTTTADMDDEVAERVIFYEGLTHMEELIETLDPAIHREVGTLLLQCIHLLASHKLRE